MPLLEGIAEDTTVYADKGYDSAENRQHLKEHQLLDGIMRKAHRNRPLTVASPNQLVSRNHILIDLDAWSVLAQDLGNCNGTVLNRQNEAPVRLSSATPVLLRSGDVLDLGDGQTLAFENLP